MRRSGTGHCQKVTRIIVLKGYVIFVDDVALLSSTKNQI